MILKSHQHSYIAIHNSSIPISNYVVILVKIGESAGVVLEPNKLNRIRHMQGSAEADGDKFADVETSTPLIHRSFRERHRNIKLAGYRTPEEWQLGNA